MGSYSSLEICGYPLWSTKYSVDQMIMTLFRESDKKIYEQRIADRNPLVWGVDIEAGDDTETVYQYSICGEYAAQRLDVMGFTLDKAKEKFNEGVKAEIDNDLIIPEILRSEREKKARLLSQYTFEKWMDTFRLLIERKIPPWASSNEKEKLSPLLRFVLDDDDTYFYHGFPVSDIRYFLRAVLEVVDSTDELVLDITELVHAGEYTGTEELSKIVIAEFSEQYVASSAIIVLTEGATDTRILSETLSLLYPHLLEYFSFLDFGVSNMEGGAANLVRIVRAFTGSGVVNRIIAVFDNDTAARDAMKGLDALNIPKNIVTMRYPPIPYANNYPTIGPQGSKSMNVNGLAGSLELYFGEDILKTDVNEFTPILWKGYNQRLKQYQGEIDNKTELQSSYLRKVQKCRKNRENLLKYDWSAMRSIFETIFKTFSETR
ncbi:hypothetical protein ES703_35507 [subsurface metagenome]|nr:hypothetical protein [Dehalococcoidia bacterium]